MEGVSDPSWAPPESSSDKSMVLDVKPLRTLVPVFPDPPSAPTFVPSIPSGPFPAGFTPFYPFCGPQGTPISVEVQQGASAAVPLRSFGTPQMGGNIHFSGPSNGDTGSAKVSGEINFGDGTTVRKKRGRKPGKKNAAERAKKLDLSSIVGLPPHQREDGNRDLVHYVLIKFDGLRRRISQIEDAKEARTDIIRRADLKAGNILMTTGFRTNNRKRIGAVPGIEVGDIFFFRMELCTVGLHSQSMAGIDFIGSRGGESEEEAVAVSIVSSGGYEDDAEDKDVLIYTGQGGGNYSGKEDSASDQKLVRGNLAMDRSLRRASEVRVIRGIKNANNPSMKTYIYDGLYTVQDFWTDRGKSGANTFKYKLVRSPGQPPAFAVWQFVQKWKDGRSSRPGQILPDVTSGAESVQVPLVNDVDNDKLPPYFTYTPALRYTRSFNLTESAYGCSCRDACAAGDLNCGCIRKNGGHFPYTASSVLVSRKPLVYECGPSCPCNPSCKNRVSQTGLKLRMEVFKTKDKGWGLRSWEAIRAGKFVCEYAGEVIDKAKYDRDLSEHNDYVFDTSRAFENFKWNYDPALLGEETTADLNEQYNIPSPLVISAKDLGNIARFMNHSCSPNVFWQPVVYESNRESFIHIAFFAMRHIPPMTELTYDYGISQNERRRKRCFCGSPKCKGYFG